MLCRSRVLFYLIWLCPSLLVSSFSSGVFSSRSFPLTDPAPRCPSISRVLCLPPRYFSGPACSSRVLLCPVLLFVAQFGPAPPSRSSLVGARLRRSLCSSLPQFRAPLLRLTWLRMASRALAIPRFPRCRPCPVARALPPVALSFAARQFFLVFSSSRRSSPVVPSRPRSATKIFLRSRLILQIAPRPCPAICCSLQPRAFLPVLAGWRSPSP